MVALWNAFWNDESGQDLAEYALLIALIALVVIAAVTLLGQNINTVFTNIANSLTGAAGGS
ncbi:MAG: Flp family type IVb pilin [Gemmatimonadetes bacterium]|jgi:pilus assembly protein Flp/PilA|nr:Flp family type IVb pilin [Gemmatimonadota bacterium]